MNSERRDSPTHPIERLHKPPQTDLGASNSPGEGSAHGDAQPCWFFAFPWDAPSGLGHGDDARPGLMRMALAAKWSALTNP